MPNPSITFKQGDKFYSPTTGAQQGTVQFDNITGAPLSAGQTTTLTQPTAIPASAIVNPPTPLVAPAVAPPVASGALTTAMTPTINAAANAVKVAAATPTTPAQNTSDVQTIVNDILGTGQEGKLTQDAYDAAGVSDIQKRVAGYQNSLDTEQRNLQNQIAQIQGSGGSKAQSDADIANLTRQSQNSQANIAINLNAANRDYTTATAIADKQVQLALEPLKAKLDADKFVYENNKEFQTRADEERIHNEEAKYQSALELGNYKAKAAVDAAALSHGDTAYGATSATPSTYTVKSSDTGGLYQIATALGIDPESLKTLNPQLFRAPISPTSNANYAIKTGDVINLPKLTAGNDPTQLSSNPTVNAWANVVLNGNGTMAQVPAAYKTAVATALSNPAGGSQFSPLASSRFATASNRIVSNFIALPQYQLTSNGLPYLQRIDAALKTPGSISDQDLLDSLTKLNTAGNAVTDAQIKLITGSRSYADAASVFANKFKNGGSLSDKQRTQIQEIAKAIYANYQSGYQPVYDQAASQLTAAGIPKAFWTIPDLNSINKVNNAGSQDLLLQYQKDAGAGTYTTPIDVLDNFQQN